MTAGADRTAISSRVRARRRRCAAARGGAGGTDVAASPAPGVPCDWRPSAVSVPRVSLMSAYSALLGGGLDVLDDVGGRALAGHEVHHGDVHGVADVLAVHGVEEDRKSTRLNSSHVKISYAVFC